MNEDSQGRIYTDDILVDLQGVSTPQVFLDCAQIYTEYYGWIAEYAALPIVVNPPPVFYRKPGWRFLVESLTLNYYAASLPEATAPEVKANSTQNDKLISAKSLSRSFKKFELTLLQRKSPSANWSIIGIEDLYNYGNIFNYAPLKNPMLTQGEVDVIGPKTQFAIKFREKTISKRIELPVTGTDILTLRGSWSLLQTL